MKHSCAQSKNKHYSRGVIVASVKDISSTVSSNSWNFPTFPIKLSNDDVHVWRLNLDQPDLHVLKFASMLSEEERIRAANFRFKSHKKRFIIGRGVLRKILSIYTKIKPEQIEFRCGIHGKPCLVEQYNKSSLQFNLAHSHELALYAFTKWRRVGVDLEYTHDIPEFERIAPRLFSKQEIDIFMTVPKNQRLKAFFNYWTIREAYYKAIGTGLAESSNRLDLSLVLKEPVSIFCTERNVNEDFHWSLTSFTPARDYIATLVVEGYDWHLHNFQYVPENNID